MSLEKLKTIVPIPNSNLTSFLDDSSKWKEFEKKLGVVLPSDYKEFMTSYGSGIIGDFIMIYSPFSENENMNFFIQQNLYRDAYVTLKLSFPEDFPYEIFPKHGGLLPWGRTENGDILNWIVDITQDDWAILVDDGSGNYFEYKGSMTGFLYDVLSENITCSLFPDDFPDKDSKNSFISLTDY